MNRFEDVFRPFLQGNAAQQLMRAPIHHIDAKREKRQITVDHRSEDSLWFTITDGEGRIVGETGLLRMFPAWHQTDLTIIIPDPQMQHKGYGTEAMEIMLDLAFHEYKMGGGTEHQCIEIL